MHKIIRLPEVIKITGLARSTLYKAIKQQSFPRQIRLGRKSVGWLEEELMQWVQTRIEESRPGE